MLGLVGTIGMIAFLNQGTSQVAEQRVFLQETSEDVPSTSSFTEEEQALHDSNYFCQDTTEEVFRKSLETLTALDLNQDSLVTFDEVETYYAPRRAGYARVNNTFF